MENTTKKGCRILPYWRSIVVCLTPILSTLIFIASTSKETRCAYVIIVMAVFYITESLPLAVTSLIPVLGFPIMGILSSKDICRAYMNETNMLFIGGLMVAIAVEYCNLHRRIALFTVLKIGQSPRQLMAGFMLTTMFLSMWISNTASTAMMIPIVDAILQELNKTNNADDLMEVKSSKDAAKDLSKRSVEDLSVAPLHQSKTDLINNDVQISAIQSDLFSKANAKGKIALSSNEECKIYKNMYFLSIANAANIGGTGSLMGTGPNLVVKGVLDSSFTEPSDLNFASWMAFNVPGMLLCTLCGWLWLQFWFLGFGRWSRMPATTETQALKTKEIIRKKYQELGTITFHETIVLCFFIFQVLLWFFREPGFMVGWASLFRTLSGNNINVGNSVPAILVVLALFAIPQKPNCSFLGKKFCSDKTTKGPSPGCITWEVVQAKLPWGIFLLLGGGFAISTAATASGLSLWLGEQLRGVAALPSSLGVLLISMATAMATEVTSNTAVASLLMPILKDLSVAICVNPLLFMLPAAVCCSYAFMLPVASPPNALVHAAANMKTSEMMKVGFAMNIFCVLVINVMINTLGVAMFNIKDIPVWANSSTGEYIPHCFEHSS